MALMKLRDLDGSSVGVTIPKDDLREEGLIGENGELIRSCHVAVRYQGEEWKVELDPLNELDRETQDLAPARVD